MTVAEMRRRMSTHEFMQWAAYYRAEAAAMPVLAKRHKNNN